MPPIYPHGSETHQRPGYLNEVAVIDLYGRGFLVRPDASPGAATPPVLSPNPKSAADIAVGKNTHWLYTIAKICVRTTPLVNES